MEVISFLAEERFAEYDRFKKSDFQHVQSSILVIQAKFWVFWAITIPLTLLVFIAWFVLSYDTAILRQIIRLVK